MKIIHCQASGYMDFGVPIKSDTRGHFLSLGDEEASIKNLEAFNAGAIPIYNYWRNQLIAKNLYMSKLYLSHHIPPDMMDWTARRVVFNHPGTIRNLKIYDAYPAYHLQKKKSENQISHVYESLELVDGLYYDKRLMKFPEEAILLILEIKYQDKPVFVANFDHTIVAGLSFVAKDNRYVFVTRQVCVMLPSDELMVEAICFPVEQRPENGGEFLTLYGQKLYEFLQNQ
jgi:hypothetical protein